MKCLIKPASVTRRWVFVKQKRSTFFWKKKEQLKTEFQHENPEQSLFSFPQNNFVDFYSKLKTTIDETIKSPSKLDLLIKEKGADKVLSELEGINKIIKEGKSGNETFRYMDFTEFLKYKQANEGKMKFVMPLFWGWAFPVVKYCSIALLSAKMLTGIPWMPFFILSGVVIRILMLPLMVRQMVLVQRMAKISPNIRLLTYCVMKTDLPFFKKYWYYSRAVFKYCRDVKVNLFSFAAYNLFQIPVFFTMVMSIRKIASEEDLTGTGIFWFKNLNEADPYMILPILSVTLTYYNLGRGINKDNEHWFINRWRSLFQVIQVIYLPFTCLWPAGSHLYWITSTALVFLQTTITRHPYFLSKINPTYFIDMQRVFETERSKQDSERFVEKLKNIEDTRIKSPTSKSGVLYELRYERTRMELYQKNLKYKRRIKDKRKALKSIFKSSFTKIKERFRGRSIKSIVPTKKE